MSDLIQLRGGTYPILNATNPILAERELVLELDTGRFKVGDGTHAWLDLDYYGYEALTNYFDTRYAPIEIAWFRRFTTTGRPDPSVVDPYTPEGTYYDTTLNVPAWTDGTDWRDATGTVI